MINHAASINRKRMDARIEYNRTKGKSSIHDEVADMPLVGGKKLTELTSDELVGYYGGDAPRPRVIKTKE